MIDNEPKGLDMSLDEIISQSQDSLGFKCYGCGKMFDSKDAMMYHKKTTHFTHDREFICYDCGLNYTSREELRNHMCEKRSFVCFTCRNKGIVTAFSSKGELFEHKSIAHSPIPQYTSSRELDEYLHVDYVWLNEGTLEEALDVEYNNVSLVKIHSTGNVEINGDVPRHDNLLYAINLCLAPVDLKLSYDTAKSDDWYIQNKSGWRTKLEGIK